MDIDDLRTFTLDNTTTATRPTTTTTTKSHSIEDGYMVHSNVQLDTSSDAKMISEFLYKIAMSATLLGLYKKYTMGDFIFRLDLSFKLKF